MPDNKDISVLKLQNRITNVLRCENIHTIQELMDAIEDGYVIKFQGIGKISFNLIQSNLTAYLTSKLNRKAEENIDKSLEGYAQSFEPLITSIFRKELEEALNYMQARIDSRMFANINEIRTLVLEQGRILQQIQTVNEADGVVHKISQKVPGFTSIMNELYRKMTK